MPSAKIDGFSENFLDGRDLGAQKKNLSDLPQLVCGLSRGVWRPVAASRDPDSGQELVTISE